MQEPALVQFRSLVAIPDRFVELCDGNPLDYSSCPDMRSRGKGIGRTGVAQRRWAPGSVAPGALDPSWRKEDLSITYLHALAASIGVTCDHSDRDINGWDVKLAAKDTEEADALQLTIQLKCTAGRLRSVAGGYQLAFPLGLDDYDHLRRVPVHPPRLLVVVRVPEFASPGWITESPTKLLVNAAAWYADLAGMPSLKSGQESTTIRIPSEQRLTAKALLAHMRSCI
jgi:Domain of unknown function (DUF4365)